MEEAQQTREREAHKGRGGKKENTTDGETGTTHRRGVKERRRHPQGKGAFKNKFLRSPLTELLDHLRQGIGDVHAWKKHLLQCRRGAGCQPGRAKTYESTTRPLCPHKKFSSSGIIAPPTKLGGHGELKPPRHAAKYDSKKSKHINDPNNILASSFIAPQCGAVGTGS